MLEEQLFSCNAISDIVILYVDMLFALIDRFFFAVLIEPLL